MDADDDRILLNTGVFPQLLRNHNPPLAVQLTLDGVGEQRPHDLGLSHGERGKLLREAIPSGLWIDGKAGVHPHSQVEGNP